MNYLNTNNYNNTSGVFLYNTFDNNFDPFEPCHEAVAKIENLSYSYPLISNIMDKIKQNDINIITEYYPPNLDNNYHLKGNFIIGTCAESDITSMTVLTSNQTNLMEETQSKNNILCYKKTLENSKKYLGMNISMIAKILNLSRPTIYSYLKGNEPDNTVSDNKITQINHILEIVRDTYKFHTFSSLFKRRDKEGKTLVEYLIEGNSNLDKFVFELCNEEQQRRSSIKKDSSKKTIVNKELLNVPISREYE
ncbi:MAG: hypothetical protein ACRQFF_07295 [Sphaerochaeta sp.]